MSSRRRSRTSRTRGWRRRTRRRGRRRKERRGRKRRRSSVSCREIRLFVKRGSCKRTVLPELLLLLLLLNALQEEETEDELYISLPETQGNRFRTQNVCMRDPDQHLYLFSLRCYVCAVVSQRTYK